MNEVKWRQVILTGILLGAVAASMVWFLERFETRRMIGEMHESLGKYLDKHDGFQAWLREHGRTDS